MITRQDSLAIGEMIPVGLTMQAMLPTLVAQLDILLGQLDFAISGNFGLGGLLFDAQLEFNAAISAAADIGIAIGNPLVALQAVLQAALQIELIPTIDFSASLSANLAVAAAIQAKIGGIKLIIDLLLKVKGPAISARLALQDFILALNVAMGAGGFAFVATDDEWSVEEAMDEIKGRMSTLAPFHSGSDKGYFLTIGVMEPTLWENLQFFIKVQP